MSPFWLFSLVETGLADVAFFSFMVHWARRRKRAYILNRLDSSTATPLVDDVLLRLSGAETAMPARLRRAQMSTNAIRRVVNTQAFYYLNVAAFNGDSYLHREGRSFLRMLASRSSSRGPSGSSTDNPLMRI